MPGQQPCRDVAGDQKERAEKHGTWHKTTVVLPEHEADDMRTHQADETERSGPADNRSGHDHGCQHEQSHDQVDAHAEIGGCFAA